MSTLPWGTMNDWLHLEVEMRAANAQRRLNARAARATRRTRIAQPVTATEPVEVAGLAAVSQPVAPAQPAISKAGCTEAA